MRYFRKATAATLCVVMGLALLTGCANKNTTTASADGGVIVVANSPDEAAGSNADKTPLGEASDFTLDFETLEYSFVGCENAQFYYIKVYPVENGTESNSASFQSEKIAANNTNAYTGTVEGETLLAGDYVAHVVASASGYSSSDIAISGSSTLLANPSVKANWNTGSEADPTVTVDITITPGDAVTSSFTLKITNANGEVVYTNEAATSEALNLAAADLKAEALTTEDVYTVTVTVNEITGYKTPAEAVEVQVTEAMRFGPPM